MCIIPNVVGVCVVKLIYCVRRYVDLLSTEEVHQAKYFVSHRWQNSFCDLVSQLEKYIGVHDVNNAETPFLWLDIVCTNQHKFDDGLFHEILPTSLGSTYETLLCMDPNGLVLTRAWCLYEIWNTVTVKGPMRLRILMAGLDMERIRDVSVARSHKTNLLPRSQALVRDVDLHLLGRCKGKGF
jgi:hypothetical protein